MILESDCVILLTATIKPFIEGGTIVDINDRYQMYKEALDWYLQNTNCKIIFAENSGAEMLDKYDVNRVEFVQCSENQNIPSCVRGGGRKSYGEILIMETVWKNSIFIKKCKYIIKITGRLKCKNIIDILRAIPPKYPCLSYTINVKGTYADSRVIFLSKNMGEKIFALKSKLDWNFGFEELLCTLNKDTKSEFVFMPKYPQMSGICGGTGMRYNLYGLRLLQAQIKHTLKKISYYIRKYVC